MARKFKIIDMNRISKGIREMYTKGKVYKEWVGNFVVVPKGFIILTDDTNKNFWYMKRDNLKGIK